MTLDGRSPSAGTPPGKRAGRRASPPPRGTRIICGPSDTKEAASRGLGRTHRESPLRPHRRPDRLLVPRHRPRRRRGGSPGPGPGQDRPGPGGAERRPGSAGRGAAPASDRTPRRRRGHGPEAPCDGPRRPGGRREDPLCGGGLRAPCALDRHSPHRVSRRSRGPAPGLPVVVHGGRSGLGGCGHPGAVGRRGHERSGPPGRRPAPLQAPGLRRRAERLRGGPGRGRRPRGQRPRLSGPGGDRLQEARLRPVAGASDPGPRPFRPRPRSPGEPGRDPDSPGANRRGHRRRRAGGPDRALRRDGPLHAWKRLRAEELQPALRRLPGGVRHRAGKGDPGPGRLPPGRGPAGGCAPRLPGPPARLPGLGGRHGPSGIDGMGSGELQDGGKLVREGAGGLSRIRPRPQRPGQGAGGGAPGGGGPPSRTTRRSSPRRPCPTSRGSRASWRTGTP